MLEAMPDTRPEFVQPKRRRMTPWVKAFVILTSAFFLLLGAFIVLIVGIGKLNILEAVWL